MWIVQFIRHVVSPEDLQGGGEKKKENWKGSKRKNSLDLGAARNTIRLETQRVAFYGLLHVPVAQRPDSIVCSWQGGETGGIGIATSK